MGYQICGFTLKCGSMSFRFSLSLIVIRWKGKWSHFVRFIGVAIVNRARGPFNWNLVPVRLYQTCPLLPHTIFCPASVEPWHVLMQHLSFTASYHESIKTVDAGGAQVYLLVLGVSFIYEHSASHLSFKALSRLWSPLRLERIQSESCGSTWSPSLLLYILYFFSPCCLFTFCLLNAQLHHCSVISCASEPIKAKRVVYMLWHRDRSTKGCRLGLSVFDMLKEEGWAKECFTTPLCFFSLSSFRISSSFFCG